MKTAILIVAILAAGPAVALDENPDCPRGVVAVDLIAGGTLTPNGLPLDTGAGEPVRIKHSKIAAALLVPLANRVTARFEVARNNLSTTLTGLTSSGSETAVEIRLRVYLGGTR